MTWRGALLLVVVIGVVTALVANGWWPVAAGFVVALVSRLRVRALPVADEVQRRAVERAQARRVEEVKAVEARTDVSDAGLAKRLAERLGRRKR